MCHFPDLGATVPVPVGRYRAFKANEAFQKRMRESGVKDHVPTKIVTRKVRLGDGEHVNPGMHLFGGGGKIRAGVKDN